MPVTNKKAAPNGAAVDSEKVVNGSTKVGENKDTSRDYIPFDDLNRPDDFSTYDTAGDQEGGAESRGEDSPPPSEGELLSIKAAIRFDTNIPPARPVIQIRCGDVITTFATLKNFSLIVGKAKSKKTFFVVLLLAGFFQGRALSDKIHCIIYPGKNRIIIFDTEQADFHVQRMLKRLMSAAGLTSQPYTLEVFCLRPYSTKERRQIVEYILYNRKDIAVAVIDGIRDLITDINSAEEATNITSLLMKWTHDLNIHIVNILHENKNDKNARGHIGAELTNKAESVLSTQKDSQDKSVSVVTAEYFRDRDFKPFGFSVDDSDKPYILDAFEPSPSVTGRYPGQKAKTHLTFDDIPKEIHCLILKQVLGHGEKLLYKDLIPGIKAAFADNQKKMGNSSIIDIVAMYRLKGWLTQEKGSARYPANILGDLPC